MQAPISEAVEVTTFQLNGYTCQQFIEANKEVDAFLLRQKGFQSRRIIESNNGLISDILIWDNVEDGTNAMHQLLSELADSKVHTMINQSTVDWNIAAVNHFVNLKNESF